MYLTRISTKEAKDDKEDNNPNPLRHPSYPYAAA